MGYHEEEVIAHADAAEEARRIISDVLDGSSVLAFTLRVDLGPKDASILPLVSMTREYDLRMRVVNDFSTHPPAYEYTVITFVRRK